MLSVRNPRRPWLSWRYSARKLYGFSAGFALAGAAGIIYSVIAKTNWTDIAIGALWLMLAAGWFLTARQLRRREQLGTGQGLPVADQDVLTLVRQGRKMEAIRHYRQLNPGVGLVEAKNVIDEL